MDYQTMNHSDAHILKLINMITLENSNAINIEKFITIIQGDIDLGLSLLMLFKQQAYEYLANLHYAVALKDTNPHIMFEAIHAIKGASLSIAADKVSNLSAILEKQIHTKQMITPENFDTLIQETQKLLNHIIAIEMRQSLKE